jgi:hypothetical protein
VDKTFASPHGIIKERGWRGMVKLILVESKGRASGDGMKTKRYGVAMKVGVAISTDVRPLDDDKNWKRCGHRW